MPQPEGEMVRGDVMSESRDAQSATNPVHTVGEPS